MTDARPDDPSGTAPMRAGERLRVAREAKGMSLGDVAARTRIVQRFLQAVEEGRYADLPSSTYAVGFAKAYARVVDLDDVEIGRETRDEVAGIGVARPRYEIEEIADPARGPSRGLVIVAAGIAVAVLVLGALWIASGLFRGTVAERDPFAGRVAASAPVPAASAPNAAAAAAAPTGGPVVLTATDEVWLRVYDAENTRLFEGTMKAGDRFQVPANANRPMINIGRPDKLRVSIAGREQPPLGDGKRALKDVGISAAALAARGATPVPTPSASPSSPSGVGAGG